MGTMKKAGTTARAAQGRGLSLVELLVVLALLGILLGLAVPGVLAWRARHELQSVAEDVWNGLVLARSQALVQQQRVMLCPLATDGRCDARGQWQQGWQVFVDVSHNGQREPDERQLLKRAALPSTIKLQGNSTVAAGVKYGPDGRSDGLAGTFTLCHAALGQGWRVVVNQPGRPRLEPTGTQDCL